MWAWLGSNQRPLPCQGSARSAALRAHVLPEVKKRVPFDDVGTLIVVCLVFIVGLYLGARYLGGPYYVRQIAQTQHRTLRRQAGLRD